MGGVCTTGVSKNNNRGVEVLQMQDHEEIRGFSGKLKTKKSSGGRQNKIDDSSHRYPDLGAFVNAPNIYDSSELRLSISRELKPSNMVPQMGSFLGKAGSVGLEKAVEVLDSLGSSMSNLNNNGFIASVGPRGNKIYILAFEVANTIVKGANLLLSLSEENIHVLKNDIMRSQGVRLIVSTDMKELLSFAASDKREEFDVFSNEVIRFGDLCKDPQWHNLGRFFSKLDSDPLNQKQQREEAENTVEELTSLARHTSELYHELHTLDRFEQDYHRKLEEVDALHLPRKGEGLMMLQSDVKHQRKVVRGLKKKSLWSKCLEEIVEKLVEVVSFIHQEISEVFGDNGLSLAGKEENENERLGTAGLALHYANLITQIDNIASRPTSLPANLRDSLYNGLPPIIKTALRTRLQSPDDAEKFTIPQIKGEMEKTLNWLVPVAADTTKAHQGFGWVGEWANTGNEYGKKANTGNNTVIRLQTLYHADKNKMDSYILDLVTWLHRLIYIIRYQDSYPRAVVPTKLPITRGSNPGNGRAQGKEISMEEMNLLEDMMKRRRLVFGRSKSHGFAVRKKGRKVWAHSRSNGSSPFIEFGHPKASVLDILDGLDTSFRTAS